MPIPSSITTPSAPVQHGPIEVATAAQIDLYRAQATESIQRYDQAALVNKKKILKALPWLALTTGMVLIIPASVGAASAWGTINTLVNAGAGLMFGDILLNAGRMWKNRKNSTKAQKTAHAADLDVASEIRAATDIEAQTQQRRSALKKSLAGHTILLGGLMCVSVGTIVSSASAAETIIGLACAGIAVLGGSITLPALRRNMRDPANDPVIQKAEDLNVQLRVTETLSATKNELEGMNRVLQDLPRPIHGTDPIESSPEHQSARTGKSDIEADIESINASIDSNKRDDAATTRRGPKV